MKISAKSDIGRLRSENQDSFASGELPGSAVWAVVCDGMGGAAGGCVASSTAVKIISEKIQKGYNQNMSDSSIRNLIVSAIESANAVVFEKSVNDEKLYGMGTTVVAALIKGGYLYAACAGDSRVYLISQDSIRQVTTDHSMVQEMVARGELTKEEASVHPKKNVITRALGIDSEIRVDFFQEDYIKENDIVLLCSDGLTNFVSEEDIFNISRKSSRYEIASSLVNIANNNGGGDNITVVALSD